LPTFFLDCHYAEKDQEEKTAFSVSFENTLISARMKQPYNPKDATAARPQNVKLEDEKKQLEEEKVSLSKIARDNEQKAKEEKKKREDERIQSNLREEKKQ
jgi:hypothetical protein